MVRARVRVRVRLAFSWFWFCCLLRRERNRWRRSFSSRLSAALVTVMVPRQWSLSVTARAGGLDSKMARDERRGKRGAGAAPTP
eukprot:scaffold133766_cov38-Tisochrysis_lutea.AAC.1